MGKKVKFPLEMKDGELARDLEELREKFDLEKAIEHFVNGKLCTWLQNNYEDEICSRIEALTGEEDDFPERLCAALGVAGQEVCQEDSQEIILKKRREERLKEYYPEEEAEKLAEQTADSQERLEYLAGQGYREIYLLSGSFHIHEQIHDIRFIGIDRPRVALAVSTSDEFQRQNLVFENEILPADENTKQLLRAEGWESCLLELLDVLEQELQRI